MTNPIQSGGIAAPVRRFFGFSPRPTTAAPAAPAAAPVAAAPVQPTTTAVEAQAGNALAVATPATQEVTIMLPSGGREGQVFGGVFGRMEEGKFRTDPLLKPIYLLQLLDGAEPGEGMDQQRMDVLRAMGGMPETVTITVPTELAASLKATLAHLSGARWEQLYAMTGAHANPMTRFALANESRVVREAVAQIAQTGGEIFTVQVAEPKELRFMMVSGDDDYYDSYERELTGVPQPIAVQPVVSALAGTVEYPSSGHETLSSAFNGRQEGDTVTYTHVEAFTVLADSAENAAKVLALIPPSLKARAAMTASEVMVNGQPHTLAPQADEEGPAVDVPR
jgi:hypothetical protein